MTLVQSREEALWGLRWMQDAVHNSGKTKPGFYPVIGLLGAAGKLGKKSFVNNAATLEHWWKCSSPRKKLFFPLKYKNQNSVVYLQSTSTIICSGIQTPNHEKTLRNVLKSHYIHFLDAFVQHELQVLSNHGEARARQHPKLGVSSSQTTYDLKESCYSQP